MRDRQTIEHRLANGRLAIAEKMAVGRKWHVMVTGLDFDDAGECWRNLSKLEALELFTEVIKNDVLDLTN